MEIELVHLFVKVVKMGSFTKAAESLRLPKSTVSKAISRLEQETGTKLLLRTTRSQTLTSAGRVFYDSCVGPIQAIEDAQKSLSGNDSLLNGNLKITAPEDLGTEVLAPVIGELLQKHPGLNFELVYTDQIVDLVRDGFDLAVRIGNLKESALKSKRIAEVKLILVASPQYLKKNGKIHKPEDLLSHSWLSLGTRSGNPQWILKSKNSQSKLSISPKLTSNQIPSLLKVALAHGGVGLMPYFYCRRYIESGELVHVLPDWTSAGMPISLVSPLPFSSSARLRMVTDRFVTEIEKAFRN